MSKYFQMTIKSANEDKPVLVLSEDRSLLETHASNINYDFYRIEKDGKYISGVDYTQTSLSALPQRTH